MPSLICNFCGKNVDQVDVLICGPAVYICNECIKLCSDTVRQHEIADICREIIDDKIKKLMGE